MTAGGVAASIGISIVVSVSPLFSQTWDPARMRGDLHTAFSLLVENHPRPFAVHPRDEWSRVLAEIDQAADTLDAVGFYFALQRLASLAADGHTFAVPSDSMTGDEGVANQAYPLEFSDFADGVVITAVAPEFREYLGYRLIRVDSVPTEWLMSRIAERIPSDNDFRARRRSAPAALNNPMVLLDLGLLGRLFQPILLTVQGPRGPQRVRVPSHHGDDLTRSQWARVPPGSGTYVQRWLGRTGDPFWTQYLDEQQTLFVQINRISNSATVTFADLAATVANYLQRPGLERVVIDLRTNGGGNNELLPPLVSVLSSSQKLRTPGRLFVLTSPYTFSAAVNLAAQLERQTGALFIGEPTGTGANQAGDAKSFALPQTGIGLRISTIWWEFSDSADRRRTITPDLHVPFTFADYVAGRDAAIEAALRVTPEEAVRLFGTQPPSARWQRQ